MIRIALTLVLLLAPSLAPAFDFKPSARFALNGDYVSSPPKGYLGVSGNLFLIPAMKQGDWTLLPLMAVISRTTDPNPESRVAEDTRFLMSETVMFKPQLRWTRDKATYRVFGGAKHSYNKETEKEILGQGKYDYEEYGVGLGAALAEPLALLGSVSVSLEDLHRTYGNYHEQGTFIKANKNYYSKDYDGWKLSLDSEGAKGVKFPWSFGYTLLLKNYTDSYIDTKQEKPHLAAGLRHDQLHRIEGGAQALLSEHFASSLSAGFDWNQSDQNNLDATSLVFEPDYYGYYAENVACSLSWLPRGEDGPSLSSSYNLLFRNYTGRLIRNPDGSYTVGKQADTEHSLALDGRWPLAKWVAATSSLNYNTVASNQAQRTAMKNTYDIFTAKLGVDMKY